MNKGKLIPLILFGENMINADIRKTLMDMCNDVSVDGNVLYENKKEIAGKDIGGVKIYFHQQQSKPMFRLFSVKEMAAHYMEGCVNYFVKHRDITSSEQQYILMDLYEDVSNSSEKYMAPRLIGKYVIEQEKLVKYLEETGNFDLVLKLMA